MTKQDFKVGTTFQIINHSEYGQFTITKKYDEGTWEARSERGVKTIFENEAKFYSVI